MYDHLSPISTPAQKNKIRNKKGIASSCLKSGLPFATSASSFDATAKEKAARAQSLSVNNWIRPDREARWMQRLDATLGCNESAERSLRSDDLATDTEPRSPPRDDIHRTSASAPDWSRSVASLFSDAPSSFWSASSRSLSSDMVGSSRVASSTCKSSVFPLR